MKRTLRIKVDGRRLPVHTMIHLRRNQPWLRPESDSAPDPCKGRSSTSKRWGPEQRVTQEGSRALLRLVSLLHKAPRLLRAGRRVVTNVGPHGVLHIVSDIPTRPNSVFQACSLRKFLCRMSWCPCRRALSGHRRPNRPKIGTCSCFMRHLRCSSRVGETPCNRRGNIGSI